MVSVRNVSVKYSGRDAPALNEISMDIAAGVLTGLSGPSGCGKSTLARCIAGWQKPNAGAILRKGEVQLVMQDPGASLNPRFSAWEIVEEPLRIANRGKEAQKLVGDLLRRVGIAESEAAKTSGRFSGGQRARLAIARALAAVSGSPGGLVVLDESLSALDAATRSEILALLRKLRDDRDMAFLLISHDRELLAAATESTILMKAGRITCSG